MTGKNQQALRVLRQASYRDGYYAAVGKHGRDQCFHNVTEIIRPKPEEVEAALATIEAALKQPEVEEIKKAAACLLVPQPGIACTIWYNDHVTLYEQLLGIAGVTDLTGDIHTTTVTCSL